MNAVTSPRPAGSGPGAVPPSELRLAFAAQGRTWRRVFGFSVAAGLLTLAPSVYMLEVYGRAVDSANLTTLAMLTVAVLGAYVVMEALDWVRTSLLHEAGIEADRSVSPRLFSMLFDSRYAGRTGASGLQPMHDWRTVREFVESPFVLAAMDVPVATLFLVLVFAIDAALGWLTVAGAIVQVGIAWATERSTQPPLREANRSAMAAQQFADASLRNVEVVEALGMLPDLHGRWMERQREFLAQQARASLAAGALQSAARMVQQVMGSALLGFSAWLAMTGGLAGGPAMMIVASIIGGRVLSPLVQMVAQWRLVVNARDAWGRLDAFMSAMPRREPAMPLPAPQGRLTVEQLVAGPPPLPGQTPVAHLRGIQFSLQPGEVLAVIGPSGAGKTTLARLLVGFWPAMSGKVRLDGVDVHGWDKEELGPHVGYLPQGVEIFDGTLAENVARFGEVEPGRIDAALRAAGLESFVASLPQGADTRIGRDGVVLSGGQRQRVALARALYGDPALLVLDEPDASLDTAGDEALAQALRDLKGRGATVVIVTHRAGLLALTDRVLLLHEGVQQAFGPTAEVMAALREGQTRGRPGAPMRVVSG